jgi:hypothetical protein
MCDGVMLGSRFEAQVRLQSLADTRYVVDSAEVCIPGPHLNRCGGCELDVLTSGALFKIVRGRRGPRRSCDFKSALWSRRTRREDGDWSIRDLGCALQGSPNIHRRRKDTQAFHR